MDKLDGEYNQFDMFQLSFLKVQRLYVVSLGLNIGYSCKNVFKLHNIAFCFFIGLDRNLETHWIQVTRYVIGRNFVGRNYSSGEIFVTKRKIRHFRPAR